MYQETGNKFNKYDIGVIAKNKEKYIRFNVKIIVKLAGLTNRDGKEVRKNIQLRFIESCRFMPFSPDKLASNLDDYQCKNLGGFYKGNKMFKLTRRKGVYQFEHMDGWEKFEERKL